MADGDPIIEGKSADGESITNLDPFELNMPVPVSLGGTGGSSPATARANLGLTDVYTYGVNSPGVGGQVWTSDGSGVGNWTTPGVSPAGVIAAQPSNVVLTATDGDIISWNGTSVGLRSNGGQMQYRNSGGSWTDM